MRFHRVPADSSGVAFRNELREEHVKRYLENGAGVAVGDYDGDGRPDLYFVSIDGANRLFRQKAPLVFEDVTDKAGVDGGDAWGTGATFVDIDGDGDLDLHVCNLGSENLLYENQGDGRFVEKAAAYGLAIKAASVQAAFADYDRDGDLDMYLLTNRVFSVEEEVKGAAKVRMVDGKPTVHPDSQEQYMLINGRFTQAGQADRLLENRDGRFVDVSEAAGISGFDMGLSATWWDEDGDGDLDLYVANDLKSPDHLYQNQGDGTFVDVLPERVSRTPWFSMGADAADVNNDGREDLLVADMASTSHFKAKATMGDMGDSAWFLDFGEPRQFMRNALYLNTGMGRFLEASYMARISNTDWTWSVKFGDLDNDGWVDLHVTNGHARTANDSDLNKLARQQNAPVKFPPQLEKNLAFRNRGGLSFENASQEWGLDEMGISHGAVFSDLDRDGDLDIVVNNLNRMASIYENRHGGKAVLLSLKGRGKNTYAIGAHILARAGQKKWVRRLMPTRGYMSADEPLVHFGVGDADRLDEVVVTWPTGGVSRLSDVSTQKLHTIFEPEDAQARVDETLVSALFEQATDASRFHCHHRETPFDDFAKQPLLPAKLSQLGPGVAWADVDGDGDDDAFVGGAAGQAGQLLLQSGGRYVARQDQPWHRAAHRAGEDSALLFFDVDGDGDDDLYVGKGSAEFAVGDARLRDRLYLNDGSGHFTESSVALPASATGAITAGDYDGDGDLDLFVGARLVPGAYPTVPESTLFENRSGVLHKVGHRELASVGMVTSALFTDANGDGKADLLVALDWGAVELFLSEDGELRRATARSGLATATGLWRGLAQGDIDGDGDLDYVATNLGLNTKYHASSEHPLLLYYFDFDGDGAIELVEADYEEKTLYPVRGRSCSSGAMPFIAEEFPTFRSFAKASLRDIYGDKLVSAPVVRATTLASSILRNQGQGRFVVETLPELAQIAPGHGVTLSDVDADGDLDIFMAQNFFANQPETGRMDGGLGALLLNDGTGAFSAVWPEESGLVLPYATMGGAITDANGDARPDVAAMVNDRPASVWVNRSTTGRPLRIQVGGPPGNPRGFGARVTVKTADGKSRTQEISAGGSYMSQSVAAVFFGLGKHTHPSAIEVQWPDGRHRAITSGLENVSSVLKVGYPAP